MWTDEKEEKHDEANRHISATLHYRFARKRERYHTSLDVLLGKYIKNNCAVWTAKTRKLKNKYNS
jgi:hypothetical protein